MDFRLIRKLKKVLTSLHSKILFKYSGTLRISFKIIVYWQFFIQSSHPINNEIHFSTTKEEILRMIEFNDSGYEMPYFL